MDSIPFPSNYKQPLLKGTKNTTIRTHNEVSKYKEGNVYRATSENGEDWGVKIKITKVLPVKVSKLSNFGIPRQSINALLKKEGVSTNTEIDLIKFEIV